jgi:threonine-phosphate decarboxylase
MTEHGGNIYLASRKTGIPAWKILDFSASINPLGIPKIASDAIRGHIAMIPHYPEPFAETLSAYIAQHCRVNHRSVLCGNGSNELIHLIARVMKPKKVLLTAPTFSEYEKACRDSNKAEVKRLKLRRKDDFDADPALFIKSMSDCDMAFLCNPNNPTGRLIAKKDVMNITDAARETRTYLVVDEAFIDFCPDESVIRAVSSNPYLIVLRSLTKFYALAGLRIGYGIFPLPVAELLRRHKEPWTVNSLAAAAGKAVLNDSAYRAASLETMRQEKRFMEGRFDRAGIRYIPSKANYYLVEMKNAGSVVRSLAEKGILVRDCSNFKGLGSGYIRVAVLSRKENKTLIAELARLCAAS